MEIQRRHAGVALVTASAACWSLAGLFVRLADMDSASLVVWSALSACIGLASICAFRLRGNLLRACATIGSEGFLYIVVATACTISYLIALQYTTVANVMTIYASLPFVATVIAFLWLKERASGRFVTAGAVAIIGVAITAGAVVTSKDLTGLVAAAVMTATFAGQLVIAKRYPAMDILLVTAMAAGLSAMLAAPFMTMELPSFVQITGSVLYGLVPYGLGTALALSGGRLINSGEAGFIAMLDVVLGPLWVWLFFNEQPTAQAVVGGLMVLGAVAWYLSNERSAIPLKDLR